MSTLSQLRRLFVLLGLTVAICLGVAGGTALALGYSTHDQVSAQLAQEHITFPDKGSKSLTALPPADQAAMAQFSGQEMKTGSQAKAFADNYILVHMNEATKGKSYAQMEKTDPVRATALTGDTLRGMLLSAYAWWMVGSYAIIGGFVLIGLGVVMALVTLIARRFAPSDNATI